MILYLIHNPKSYAYEIADNFSYPLSNWVTTCGFSVPCAYDNHLGVDGYSDDRSGDQIPGTPVYAPCNGEVKEAQSHSRYGGTVLIEANTGSEIITILIAHMSAATLVVEPNTEVQYGQLIGFIGTQQENGGWDPHCHMGIHKGSYQSYCIECSATPYSCNGNTPSEWVYAGYTYCPNEILPNWHDPEVFIASYSYTYLASYADQTPHYPPDLDYYPVAHGQILSVSFVFNNNGTAYWTGENDPNSPHYIELHSVNSTWDADSTNDLAHNWIEGSNVRIATTSGNVEALVGQGLYEFDIQAPSVLGDYFLYVALYRPHSAEFISGTGPTLHIRVQETYISGNLAGTLYVADSPYIVNGNIAVPPGQTLVIEPSCLFIFQDHYKFIVNANATLQAIGTEADSIVFTAANTDDGWHGIRFFNASSDSRLEYCVIEYGNAYPDAGWDHWGGGVFCYYSDVTISNCLVRFSKALVGLTGGGGGIAMAHSSPVVSQCTIVENQSNRRGGGGILSYASWPTITDNLITNNTSGYNGGGVKVEYGSALVSGNIFVQNTASYDHAGGGIFCYMASVTMFQNDFLQNQAGSGAGIYTQAGTVQINSNVVSGNNAVGLNFCAGAGILLDAETSGTISHNVIFNNTVTGGSTIIGGGGIYCARSQPEIHSNDIYNNNGKQSGGGIYTRHWAAPNIHHNDIYGNYAIYGGGIAVENANPLIRLNAIYDNSASSGAGIRNPTPSYATVNAINNWWGDASGPYDPSTGPPDHNPGGSGNSVSDYIAYRPWLNYSPSAQELLAETIDRLPEGNTPLLELLQFVDPGESNVVELLVDGFSQLLRVIANWFGSEINLKIYRPNGTLYGEWQSSEPPIEVDVSAFDIGTWNFEVTGVDIPYDNYPFALVVGSLPLGSISGVVEDTLSNGCSGIATDLYDESNELLICATTDQSGYYFFSDLLPGNYNVTIITPLGFLADSETKSMSVTPGDDSLVNFILTPLEIVASQRGTGFWKHQVNVYLSGRGHAQIPEGEFSGYLDMISSHFNYNPINPITLYTAEQPASHTDSLETASSLLSVQGNAPMIDRARQQLMALLLNVASLKLAQKTFISEDSATASQAITYCHSLITDEDNANDEIAKDIAEQVNSGISVSTGIIPLSTPDISYKAGTEGEAIPMVFELSQNYPNPFNAQTTINYGLPEASYVTIDIYDLLGRRITTLINSEQPAGFHQETWNSQNASSGVYFYRIKAGDYSKTKKMLLLK